MQESSESEQVRELLRDREARGLRVPLIARMILLSFAIVNVAALTSAEAIRTELQGLAVAVFGVMLLVLAANVGLFVLLRRDRLVETVGLVGAGFDALLVLAFSGLAQWAGVLDGLPLGYVFQTELPITVVTIVSLNGMALQPRYPAIVGAAAVLSVAAPAVEMLMDRGTRFTSDRVAVYLGPASDPGQVVTTLVMVAGVAVVATLAARAARVTIRHGIALEVEASRVQRQHLELVWREKIEALAKLVAGVSHELNTPLGALTSGVDTQERVIGRLEEAVGSERERVVRLGRGNLDGMREAAKRIAGLERSLRALSHLDEASYQRVDLRTEIESVLTTARRESGSSLEVEVTGDLIPSVHVGAKELNQALLTIVRRALDAAGPEGKVNIHTSTRDKEVLVQIVDSGARIPEQQMAGLFDVSFAAGDRGAANLEFATAQSIMQRHGGSIEVASGAAGTTFTVRLPLNNE